MIGSLLRPGDPVQVGTWLMEVAATETDGKQALIAFSLTDGAKVHSGQPVTITVTGALGGSEGKIYPGTVAEVSPPLRAVDVELGLALLEPPKEKQIVAAVTLISRWNRDLSCRPWSPSASATSCSRCSDSRDARAVMRVMREVLG